MVSVRLCAKSAAASETPFHRLFRLFRQVECQNGFVHLHPGDTLVTQLPQDLMVHGQHGVQQIERIGPVRAEAQFERQRVDRVPMQLLQRQCL